MNRRKRRELRIRYGGPSSTVGCVFWYHKHFGWRWRSAIKYSWRTR